MSKLTYSILCNILLITYSVCVSPNDVIKKLTDDKIIGDIINKCDGTICKAQFANVSIDLGNHIKTSDTKISPKVTFDADNSKLYTLMLVDPDVPSRENPIYGQWLHWLVINIKGHDIANGHALAPYIGPGPPAGTGYHRYVLLVYKQQSELIGLKQYVISTRDKFKARKFADDHKLGDPIAVNYFLAKHE